MGEWRVPGVMDYANSSRTYLIFGSFCFSMFFFVWFFIPETKGISLEHMDQLFGLTDGPSKPLTEEAEPETREITETKDGIAPQEKRIEQTA